MVIDPEHGTIDSPLHPDQVFLLQGATKAVSALSKAGFLLAIVTNQPASAKGKTTKRNLELVHQKIVRLIESKGGPIAGSYLCFHKSEDGCACRKPRTGLLEEAIRRHGRPFNKGSIWMVGDGLIDIQAGHALGLKTAFLAAHKSEAVQILKDYHLHPTLWVEDLNRFATILANKPARQAPRRINHAKL